MHTLDTNCIIYYLKDDAKALSVLRNVFAQPSPIYVSTITEVELFGFPGLTFIEARRLEEILGTLSIIPLDSKIARIAGALRRNYRLKTADSVIAATALFTGTNLVTRNIRDFKRIPDLKIQAL